MGAKRPESMVCACAKTGLMRTPGHSSGAKNARPVDGIGRWRGMSEGSMNVREDPVELIQAVVGDHQLALTGGGMLDRNLGAQLLGQLLLQTIDIGVTGRRCRDRAGRRLLDSPHEGLGFPYGEAFLGNQRSDLDLLLTIRQRQ